MGFEIIAENQNISKELLLNQKIVNVKFMDKTVVFHLENGCDLYFHTDTGEMQIIKVDLG